MRKLGIFLIAIVWNMTLAQSQSVDPVRSSSQLAPHPSLPPPHPQPPHPHPPPPPHPRPPRPEPPPPWPDPPPPPPYYGGVDINPDYECLNYMQPGDSSMIVSQAYSCDVNNPEREQLEGKYCYIGRQDVDWDYRDGVMSLSTTPVEGEDYDVIEDATSHFLYWCRYN